MTRHRAERLAHHKVAKYLDEAVADGWTIHTLAIMDVNYVFVVLTREE